jgi:hypothetical protein
MKFTLSITTLIFLCSTIQASATPSGPGPIAKVRRIANRLRERVKPMLTRALKGPLTAAKKGLARWRINRIMKTSGIERTTRDSRFTLAGVLGGEYVPGARVEASRFSAEVSTLLARASRVTKDGESYHFMAGDIKMGTLTVRNNRMGGRKNKYLASAREVISTLELPDGSSKHVTLYRSRARGAQKPAHGLTVETRHANNSQPGRFVTERHHDGTTTGSHGVVLSNPSKPAIRYLTLDTYQAPTRKRGGRAVDYTKSTDGDRYRMTSTDSSTKAFGLPLLKQ